ncbi:MAG TPA: hypothetical protein DCS01_06465 [Idiomarina abyssalis]|jgi:hypothetical protein|nr:hypothetical protein [Idiomarina sp.]MBH93708.1 hypothetical protein [Idiomarina sp.]HAS14926.1 hypothetical protein [Idiomarina abyssalis]|tara:strand:- start:509 stop:742 length:234 start_codon:yes stop_codon:yes gene_type:complete
MHALLLFNLLVIPPKYRQPPLKLIIARRRISGAAQLRAIKTGNQSNEKNNEVGSSLRKLAERAQIIRIAIHPLAFVF